MQVHSRHTTPASYPPPFPSRPPNPSSFFAFCNYVGPLPHHHLATNILSTSTFICLLPHAATARRGAAHPTPHSPLPLQIVVAPPMLQVFGHMIRHMGQNVRGSPRGLMYILAQVEINIYILEAFTFLGSVLGSDVPERRTGPI